MKVVIIRFGLVFVAVWLANANWTAAQDWPQWRGPNRDAKATGFHVPAEWPQELTQKWKVAVGDGVATPAVVGERVFVLARQDGNEVIRALDAASGNELWQDSYEAEAPRGGASNFPGPRSSPAVADGKVVTLGVQGTLCCYDAQSGQQLWRKDAFENEVPIFYVGTSPIIVEGMVIAQLGGEEAGGIIAYDLAGGDERWQWTEDSPSYGSPVLMNIDGEQVLITPTHQKLVAIGVNDGKTRWEMPFEQGRYNTFTPVVDGNLVIVAGPGTGVTAFRLSKRGGAEQSLSEERVWQNTDNSLQFNSPVLKDGMLFGLSNAGQLFCINIRDGEQTAWTAPINPQAEGQGERGRQERSVDNSNDGRVKAALVQFVQQEERDGRERERRQGFDRDRRRGEDRGRGGRGGGGGRRGRGGGGYGSIVDAGEVLLALSPAGELVVFKPTDEAYNEVARYKVAEEGTYAYPVAVGATIYIKDRESLTRWDVQ